MMDPLSKPAPRTPATGFAPARVSARGAGRTRDRHLLLHPARERRRRFSAPVPEPHEPQVALRLAGRDIGREAVERGVKDEVLPRGLPLVEAGLLREDADRRADLRVIHAEAV